MKTKNSSLTEARDPGIKVDCPVNSLEPAAGSCAGGGPRPALEGLGEGAVEAPMIHPSILPASPGRTRGLDAIFQRFSPCPLIVNLCIVSIGGRVFLTCFPFVERVDRGVCDDTASSAGVRTRRWTAEGL